MKQEINRRIDIVVRAVAYGVVTATIIIVHNLLMHIL